MAASRKPGARSARSRAAVVSAADAPLPPRFPDSDLLAAARAGSSPLRPRRKKARPRKSAASAARRATKVAAAGAAERPAEVPGWVERGLRAARARAEVVAAALRARYPGETPRQLGERLVQSSALRAGLLGAATGTLSIVALPVGLPAGVAATLLLEAELIFALLALYGLAEGGPRGRLRLTALWAGAGFADAAKSAGLRMGAVALGDALAGSLPGRIIARLNPLLLRAILRRLGLGFLPRAARFWPLLGAPVAFALDRAALRTLGAAALATLDDVRGRRTR